MKQRAIEATLIFIPLSLLGYLGLLAYFGDTKSANTVMIAFLVTCALELLFLYSIMIRREAPKESKQVKEHQTPREIIDVDWSAISGRNMVISDENLELWMVKTK